MEQIDRRVKLVPNKLWAGIDIGKEHHHCVVIDEAGQRLFSSRIANDETALTTLIDEALTLAAGGELLWAIDLNRGGAALVIGLLAARSQPVAYLTGLMMHRAAAGYRGEGKTDLLTELPCRSFRRCVRGSTGLARFVSHDQRQGRAARVVRTGGPGAGVARGDGRSVRAVSTR
ncbi:IS110 family transposase [Rhodococcus erythropolis]|uniref:IS110 family transposase n=1 Tax=Rhodococcus erythropolis TaxID=1833 RepID=UPI001C9AF522|nr:transposase [Rhodococcus erythropolis]MBY6383661.1 IS110 family transposase [Rhodococcus erythropolis]MBY6388802.1 IS110 family transposase [Rhodococcus erythropolis]